MIAQVLMWALGGLDWVTLLDIAVVAHVSCLVLFAAVVANAHQIQDRPDVPDALQGKFVGAHLEVSLTVEVP